MSVKVTHPNRTQLTTKIKTVADIGTTEICNEFIKDANFYCREDTSELINSSLRASRPEEGLAVWDTPYAKPMYYLGVPVTDKNPNASLMWGHKAETQNRGKYLRMLQKILDKLV